MTPQYPKVMSSAQAWRRTTCSPTSFTPSCHLLTPNEGGSNRLPIVIRTAPVTNPALPSFSWASPFTIPGCCVMVVPAPPLSRGAPGKAMGSQQGLCLRGRLRPGIHAEQGIHAQEQVQIAAEPDIATQQSDGQIEPVGQHPAEHGCITEVDDQPRTLHGAFP